MANLIVDTGFLVALYRRIDRLNKPAIHFLHDNRAPLVTTFPVVVEACNFLNPRGKVELLKWVTRGGLNVAEVPPDAYPALIAGIEKYADLEVDLADATPIWLADLLAEYNVLTVDQRGFAMFRLKGRKRFELVHWYQA